MALEALRFPGRFCIRDSPNEKASFSRFRFAGVKSNRFSETQIIKDEMKQKEEIKSVSIIKIKMIKEGSIPYGEEQIINSRAAAKIARSFLGDTDREHVLVLILDQKNRVNGINLVSTGSLSSAILHPREVFKPAILGNAARIAIIHNHVSGDIQPSQEDVKITERLREAGEILGIHVLDHIILGDGKHFSFLENDM